ncbi:MAG: ATP-dependent DNA helicase RecG [Chloroflexi bacterium]|nr:ATP-dependent DNA helicase RecG [Chloroflexota bacterium]
MSSVYDTLRRILVLEQELGYRDRAVIGGLDAFLAHFLQDDIRAQGYRGSDAPALTSSLSEMLYQYKLKSLPLRKSAVARALELLDSHDSGVSSATDPQSAVLNELPSPRDVSTGQKEVADTTKGPIVSWPHKQPQQVIVPDPSSLDADVTVIRGVSTVTQERLARLEIHSLRDLLYYFPYRYDDYSTMRTINQLALGEQATIVGSVSQVKAQRISKGRYLTRAIIRDDTGSIEVSWFNQPYLERQLHVGSEIVLSGQVSEHLGRLVLASPEWEPLERELLHTARMVPVYRLTEGLGRHALRKIIKGVLDYWESRIPESIPEAMRQEHDLMPLGQALIQMHFPTSTASLQQARHRLCFEEFLLLQLGMLRRRNDRLAQPGRALEIPHQALQAFTERLPYKLTNAQQRSVREILDDMSRACPMSRLLQGEVGSGKTIVAVMAALAVVRNGLQVAVMAPTSILAEQHYRTFSQLLAPYGDIRCELLVGSLSQSDKERVHSDIASGAVNIAIGTHALIQQEVSFANLGLIIVDEQHRFGVAQRAELRAKGAQCEPHLLAMSATPIPRSLALTVYGDLDVSILDELPPNRQKIITRVRDSAGRERVYTFMRQEIESGRQAFVICPLVETGSDETTKAAVAEQQRLQRHVFKGCQVGLLHGRMSAADKDRVMLEFREKKYNILVATSVVEVGIDIPNATVILIEGAERFGLAQLHQFRGRVGRGQHKSYCILLSDESSEETLARLQILEESRDGFEIAQKDLELRGPGDFLGYRQHGLPLLRVASLSDLVVLEDARQAAGRVLAQDPTLERPEHQQLKAKMSVLWHTRDISY